MGLLNEVESETKKVRIQYNLLKYADHVQDYGCDAVFSVSGSLELS